MSTDMFKKPFFGLVLLGILISPTWAQNSTLKREVTLGYESPILVRKGAVEVSLADFVAYMNRRVAKEDHRELVSSAARLEGLLENIALTETFWVRAKERGMMDDSFFRARLYQAAVREARDAYRETLQDEIELESYESQARELYLTEPERFSKAKAVDMEHILVSVGEDSSEVDAMKAILQAHERLMSGEDFIEVAAEISDDPTFADNQGLLKDLEISSLVPPVASAANSLGLNEYSDPIRSRFGWHIICLKGIQDADRMSWEEAKSIAERIARDRHLTEAFERILRDMNTAPMQFAPGAVRTILDHYGVDGFGIPELGQEETSEATDQ